jgi:hypothetical protein
MRQNATEKPLTAKQRKAAVHLALDELSDEQIAERLGIHRATLDRWKDLPALKYLMREEADKIALALRSEGITNKANRLQMYRDHSDQFEQIRQERAKDAETVESKMNLYGVPGATTGWIVGSLKLVKHITSGDGDDDQRVWMEESWEYSVDTAMSREINNIRKQVAQETGQWTEKAEIDLTTAVEFVGLDPDSL